MAAATQADSLGSCSYAFGYARTSDVRAKGKKLSQLWCAPGHTQGLLRWFSGGPDLLSDIDHCATADSLIALINLRWDEMEGSHTTLAFAKLSRFCGEDISHHSGPGHPHLPGGFNGALHSLSQVAIAHKDTLSPEQTATMLHAIAMLGEWDLSDEVEKALIQRAVATVGEFGPQSISETMLSVTKLFVKPDAQLLAQLVAVMSARTLEVAAHMRAKDVSDVLWALGELKAEVSEPLLDALEQRAVQVSDHFLAGEISDLLWAVAAMEKAVQWELVLALQRRAYEVMPEFNKLEARRMLAAVDAMGLHVEGELRSKLTERIRSKGGGSCLGVIPPQE